MERSCPYCRRPENSDDSRTSFVRAGHFYRTSDSKWVQRYRCLDCKRSFSNATSHPCFRQKKRGLNFKIKKELASGVSQRRIARNFNLSRSTVRKKFLFLGSLAAEELRQFNEKKPRAKIIEFDDLETFEHTKCKPLSVTLVVEHRSRRILGFAVSKMPAKGRLSKIAMKKYGPRIDERRVKGSALFRGIKDLVEENALIKSDQNPSYPALVRTHFPLALHEAHKGQRGSIVGQGELKKVRFDPLFSLNHTCAMLRANVNRLIRRTWCTTKVAENLRLHLAIYAVYHNKILINSS